MSNQICPFTLSQLDDNSVTVINKNINKKRKKLSLTNELLGGVMQFKNMILSQKKNHKINFLDPIKCENSKLDCNQTKDIKGLLHVSINVLQNIIVHDRSNRQEYIINLTKYLNELNHLDHAKEAHIKNLESFLSEEERVIESLRTDIEIVNSIYETQKQYFYKFYLEEFGPSVLLETIGKFKSLCDKSLEIVLQNVESEDTIKMVVETLCFNIHSLTAEIELLDILDCAGQSKTEIITTVTRQLEDICVEKSARMSLDELVTISNYLETDCAQTNNNFLELWYTIKSMYENNLILENTADVLDNQMETLQMNLSDVTTEYMALSASKSEKKCKSVVLDDFCVVTEEITAQQIRNLEFSRILAADDRQMSKELTKIEQLRAKISRKKNKKQKLLIERDSIKSQLEMYKSQYEDLEIRKNVLADDLINVKRSPGKLMDQSELQGVGQRVKHLKQLKVQYNKLTNKRDALKLKLQKYQQVVKPPNRTNQIFKNV
ncbi:Hypothetical protein CINCED_3A019028 [Cinara cedri]|uniref:DUF4201 domain-containing protein n=1 Tax=Cinara cedri TaxID=506608 RepID=A0A5E4NM11_9HEMI|nr:Hypothetical protein CINCED_3A019028 [Cinara cedri]